MQSPVAYTKRKPDYLNDQASQATPAYHGDLSNEAALLLWMEFARHAIRSRGQGPASQTASGAQDLSLIELPKQLSPVRRLADQSRRMRFIPGLNQ